MRRTLSLLLFSLALTACEQGPRPRPHLSPALDVVVTDAASSLCVHRDGKVEYILYYEGQLDNWSWNGSENKIEEPNLWLERGHLEPRLHRERSP